MKKEIKRKREGREEEKQEYKENDDEKERGPQEGGLGSDEDYEVLVLGYVLVV